MPVNVAQIYFRSSVALNWFESEAYPIYEPALAQLKYGAFTISNGFHVLFPSKYLFFCDSSILILGLFI